MDELHSPEDELTESVTPQPSDRRGFAALGAIGATAAGVMGAGLTELRFRAKLSKSDEYHRLRHPLKGHPLAPRSADGTLLHAEVFGADDGPTVILAPGWTETLYLFDAMTRQLVEHGFRVVGYDLRGQGHSNPPAHGDFSLARYGDDLEAVLQASCAGRSDVILVGHSMGAMSIAAWARDHEIDGRVQAAALMNTGMHTLVAASRIMPNILPAVVAAPLARWAFLGNPLPLPQSSTVISRAAIRYCAFGPHATDAQVAFFEQMLRDCPAHIRAAAGLTLNDMDLMSALEHITVPTLVLSGQRDRLTPTTQAEEIAGALPNLAELIELPGIGHMGPLEAPQLILAALLRLSERVAAPAELISSAA